MHMDRLYSDWAVGFTNGMYWYTCVSEHVYNTQVFKPYKFYINCKGIVKYTVMQIPL